MAQEPRPSAPPTAKQTSDLPATQVATLDRWLTYPWDNGVQVDTLEDLQALRVETLNSTYDLAIVSARNGEVLVRGGRYFPDWTAAQFVGCSLGGGLLKRYGVHVGFRMEFYSAGRLIITSPVRAINRTPAARSDTPASTSSVPSQEPAGTPR